MYRNVFFRSYCAKKNKNPHLKAQEFLDSISNPREILHQQWGISVEDNDVERRKSAEEIMKVKRQLSKSSEEVRNRPKREPAQDHDAHLLYIVLEERAQYGAKAAWCLTLDTSLPHAAVRIQGSEEVPFCMTLDGFLHIISPYVRADHRSSFAKMFANLVGRNIFPPERTLELADLRMFTDFDLSVRGLKGEDVKRIIRNVKKAIGGHVRIVEERDKIAYEVQKALSDPTLKYQTTLEQQIEEQRNQIEQLKKIGDKYLSEKEKQIVQPEKDKERNADIQKYEVSKLINDHDREKRNLEDDAKKHRDSVQKSEDEILRLQKRQKVLVAALVGVVAVIIGAGVWLVPDTWVSWTNRPFLFCFAISLLSLLAWLGVVLPRGWRATSAWVATMISGICAIISIM